MRARPVAVLPCLLLVTLAGCGGDDNGTSTGAAVATTSSAPTRTVIRPDRTVVSTTSSDGTTTVSSTTIPGPGTTTATSDAAPEEPEPSRRFYDAVDLQSNRLVAILDTGTDNAVRLKSALTETQAGLRKAIARAEGRGESSSAADALLADAEAAVTAAAAGDTTRLSELRASTVRHRIAFAKAFVGEG
ncbi:hypothetical protein [Patulibacter minatonensis]|uniref:hypothetical protein n=1 Tax=Patulibacter minatonensis TaxID=298163 RepID=UPI00047CB4C3|nr:hypothetical protein [Patulibacter minatonensis]